MPRQPTVVSRGEQAEHLPQVPLASSVGCEAKSSKPGPHITLRWNGTGPHGFTWKSRLLSTTRSALHVTLERVRPETRVAFKTGLLAGGTPHPSRRRACLESAGACPCAPGRWMTSRRVATLAWPVGVWRLRPAAFLPASSGLPGAASGGRLAYGTRRRLDRGRPAPWPHPPAAWCGDASVVFRTKGFHRGP